jgi:hypothetical protein
MKTVQSGRRSKCLRSQVGEVTAAREMSAMGRESNDKGTKWEELFCYIDRTLVPAAVERSAHPLEAAPLLGSASPVLRILKRKSDMSS